MRRPVLSLVDALTTQITLVPKIVVLYQKRNQTFVKCYIEWLDNVQTICINHQILEGSLFAGIKAKVLSSRYDLTTGKKLSASHYAQVVASTIEDSQVLIHEVARKPTQKLVAMKEILDELLLILIREKAMPKIKQDFSKYIHSIWATIKAEPTFIDASLKLEAVLPIQDILRLIAESIDLRKVEKM